MSGKFSKQAAQAEFFKRIEESFNNPAYSPDLIIKSGTTEFLCHKHILCPQSEWFRAACYGKFKEANSNTIDLIGDDPHALQAMLQYCYSFSYDQNDSPLFHVRVFALAEKYLVKDLAKLARDRFLVAGSAVPLFTNKTAKLHKDVTKAIAEAQKTVYDQGNMLRVAICELVVLREESLLNGKCPEFDALMEKHPTLAADVARALAKALQVYRRRADFLIHP